MAEVYSFFDSVLLPDGRKDREYNAQQFTDYFGTLITTGIMKANGDPLKVTTVGGNTMDVELSDGTAFIEGRYYRNTSGAIHTLDIESLGLDRIDRIVIRLDLNTEARHVKSFVKKGSPSVNPVPPALTRNDTVYEISVAQVRVKGGQTFIQQADITDERGDKALCGWAGSNILPNFNDDGLEALVNTVNGHVGNMDNPHGITTQQVNFIPTKHRNDPPESYPIGITMMEVKDYVADSVDPAETWYNDKGIVVTFRSPTGIGTFQLHSNRVALTEDAFGNAGDVFYRPLRADGTWGAFWWAFGMNNPRMSRTDYHVSITIDPINGNDNNDGSSQAKAVKGGYRAAELIKTIMVARTMTVRFMSPSDDADPIWDALAEMKAGPFVEVDYGGSVLYGDRAKGISVPLFIQNAVFEDNDISFDHCASVTLDKCIFRLSNYDWSQFPVVGAYASRVNLWFCEFHNAKANIHLVEARNAAHVSAIGTKFVNCSNSSRAFVASDSIIHYSQNSVTGTSPTVATEFSGGKIFTS